MPYPDPGCLDVGVVVTGMENTALSTNGVPALVLTTIPWTNMIVIEVITSLDYYSYSSIHAILKANHLSFDTGKRKRMHRGRNR